MKCLVNESERKSPTSFDVGLFGKRLSSAKVGDDSTIDFAGNESNHSEPISIFHHRHLDEPFDARDQELQL